MAPPNEIRAKFISAAEIVGSRVESFSDLEEALDYISREAGGPILVPASPSSERLKLAQRLTEMGLQVHCEQLRTSGKTAAAGLTGANWGLADTGSLAIESTDEDVRLATTLPERHFALLDPEKILPDSLAAVSPLREMHQLSARNYIAYITGPSRTADIERVLTIGVHGPRELHILLVPGISGDLLEL